MEQPRKRFTRGGGKDFSTTISSTINQLEKSASMRGWKRNRDSDAQLADDTEAISKQLGTMPVLEFNENNTGLKLFNHASNRSDCNAFNNCDKDVDIQQNNINDIISGSITNDNI